MYQIFLINSSVDVRLDRFHILFTVNNAAVNTSMHVSFQIMFFSGYMPRSGIAGSYGSYHTIALISHASKVMLKILQANTWTVNFQMFKLDLEKAEEPEIKLPTSTGIHQKSKRVPEKYLFMLYWLCQSLWQCGSQQTVENSLKNGNTRPPDLPPEKSVCRSRSNS